MQKNPLKLMTMGNFLNYEQVYNEVLEILNGVAENYQNTLGDYANEIAEEHADYITDDILKSMNKYCHQKDTSMVGNFADIRYNYKWDREDGTLNISLTFDEVVELIDKGIENDDTKTFQEWALNWFWYAFGTFGIKYNFGEYLNNIEYELEES